MATTIERRNTAPPVGVENNNNNEDTQQQQQQGLVASSIRIMSSLISSIPAISSFSLPFVLSRRSTSTTVEPFNRGKFNIGMKVRLDGDMVYSCAGCCSHLANNEEIISRSFHGKHGRAFLFNTAFNVKFGPREDRVFFTGHHTVRDVMCAECGALLGWRYEKAREKSQQYKIGKFVLEHKMIMREKSWSDD